MSRSTPRVYASARRARRQRGTVYLLVLSLTAMLVAVGVTAVTVGRIDLQSTRLEEDQADARLCAQTLIEVVRLKLEGDSGWRDRYTHDVWTPSYRVGSAAYRFKLADEQDGNLSDDPADPVRLYIQADAGDASRVYSVVLRDGKTLTEALVVGASRDDAAEDGLLGLNTTAGSSIQIGDNGLVDGIAAVRFAGLPVQPGERVIVAEAQFTSADAQAGAAAFTVWAEAADNAGPFSTGIWDIGNRDRTTTQTAWSPGAWEAGERAAAQRTPTLAALLQEVIDRPGWASGNAVAFFLEGTGTRNIRTRDHRAATAPVLHLTYTAPGLSVDYATLRRELAE